MTGTVWLIILLLTAQKDAIATAIEKVPMKSTQECHAMGSSLKDSSIEIKYFCLEGAKN
jgi:hypothetical protein